MSMTQNETVGVRNAAAVKKAAKPRKKAEPEIKEAINRIQALDELSKTIVSTMKHVSKLLEEGGDIPAETGVQVRELAKTIEKQAEKAGNRSRQLENISSALDDISGSFFALADAIKGENSSTRRNRRF